MKLRLTLDRYKEVEDDVLNLATFAESDTFRDSKTEGWYYNVHYPRIVFPMLGIAIRSANVFDDYYNSFPIKSVTVLYNPDETDPSKFIAIYDGMKYRDILKQHFSEPKRDFGKEECNIDLSEFLDEEDLKEEWEGNPESDLWKYLAE